MGFDFKWFEDVDHSQQIGKKSQEVKYQISCQESKVHFEICLIQNLLIYVYK
jgi:hypothetical protein